MEKPTQSTSDAVLRPVWVEKDRCETVYDSLADHDWRNHWLFASILPFVADSIRTSTAALE